MLPTVEEIAVKEIVAINIEEPLNKAINKMASSNLRNIVVIESSQNDTDKYYLLTINDLIDYKLNNIKEDVSLKDLHLTKAKILRKDLERLINQDWLHYEVKEKIENEDN